MHWAIVVVEGIIHLGYHNHPSTEEVVLILHPSLGILVTIHTMVVVIVVACSIRTVMEEATIHTMVVATIHTIAIMVVAIVHIIEVVPCPSNHIVIVMVLTVTSQVLRIVLVSLLTQVTLEVVHCNPYTEHSEAHYTKCYRLHSST